MIKGHILWKLQFKKVLFIQTLYNRTIFTREISYYFYFVTLKICEAHLFNDNY